MAEDLVSPMDQLKLHRHNTEQCMFQRKKHLYSEGDYLEHHQDEASQDAQIAADKKHNEGANTGANEGATSGESEEKGTTPALMLQIKRKVTANTFISRTKAAVARRKRLEQPWMKGAEMRPFFHLWEQSQCTPKGRKLKRHSSLPKDFTVKTMGKAPADMGIVRECCCKIRSRLPNFPFDSIC